MLQSIADNLWEGTFTLRMGPGLKLPCRMTVVRLPDGALWVHSPGKFSDELAETVAREGEVRYLVGPNRFHHLFLRSWKERFPNAQIIAGPGLAAKRQNLKIDTLLEEKTHESWGGVFDARHIDGIPTLDETVFLHRPTRSLILTDFFFNLKKIEGLGTFIFTTLAGTRGKPAQSRLVKIITKDKKAAGKSTAALFDWDFDRVIPAHGEIVETGGKDVLRKALSSLLPKSA